MTERLTTPEVLERLRRTFAPPQFGHVVEFERIDFLAVGAWRSTGYDVTGVEVKVSRADWRKELAKYEAKGKGEHGRMFCDFWCVAAPVGLIRPGELVDGWGLLEVDGRGCRTVVKPARRRARWDRTGSPLNPNPEYLSRYQFAMLARRWAYSDADRRAVQSLAVAELGQPRVNGDALDKAAIATGRLTSLDKHANAEYDREQREHTRAWRTHVDHFGGDPVDGCDFCELAKRVDARRAARA